MKLDRGMTIVELLVVLVVSAIMLIGVNAVANIGNRSNRRVLDETSIYNDISLAFKLMQSRIHGAYSINSSGDTLTAGSRRFKVYQHTRSDDLVYHPNYGVPGVNQVIFSMPNTNMYNGSYLALSPSYDNATKEITVNIVGEKVINEKTFNGWIPKHHFTFNVSTKVYSRRN